jgi:SAM-dependent methyltransferase
MTKSKKSKRATYFDNQVGMPIKEPGILKTFASRLALPLLALISREQAVKLSLTPIDDERVIQALRHTKGKALDIGCGANHYILSHGNGVGVDVYPWDGADEVVKDTADLPFKDGEFDTTAFLACLNHIPNRADVLDEAYRVTKKNGTLIVTMIPPLWGRFIHWIRFRNDPDHKDRDIDHDHELLGMHPTHVSSLIKDAGFELVARKRFVYGINSIYVAKKK